VINGNGTDPLGATIIANTMVSTTPISSYNGVESRVGLLEYMTNVQAAEATLAKSPADKASIRRAAVYFERISTGRSVGTSRTGGK
jgi:hypothetical protein